MPSDHEPIENSPLEVTKPTDDALQKNINKSGEDNGDEVPVIVSEHYMPSLPWHTYTDKATAILTGHEDYETAITGGVHDKDVETNRTKLGGNVIPIKGGKNVFKMLAVHFLNSITLILGIVAVISAYFGDWGEFGVVVFVIIFNGFLGFYQEYGAEKSLQGLKDMTSGSAKVKRSGKIHVIPIDEVVIGDLVILEQGASVPADLRLFEVSNLEIDEAILTGEALPVVKETLPINDPDFRCPLGDRKNIAFRNTLVSQGRGKGIVIAGGTHTEMGKLAGQLSKDDSGGKTELQKKMEYLMYSLFGVCIILGVIVFAANSFVFHETTLMYACAVAIAILPESLVAVITVAMTISVRRMAVHKCIVRKLGALEVLGNVTDICSDKTGTLTENKMVVKTAFIGLDRSFNITGAPQGIYGPIIPTTEDGQAKPGRRKSVVDMKAQGRMYRDFFRCAAMCSTTHLFEDPNNVDHLKGTGNPTEIAMQVMTWKAGLNREYFEETESLETVAEYAFDSVVKRMSVIACSKTKPQTIYSLTKGAPERITEICKWHINESGALVKLTEEDHKKILEDVEILASQGLRTICLSERNLDVSPVEMPQDEPFDKVHPREDIESDLIFLGIVGIFDPPRPESAPSVYTCQQAGIKVRMLTGDHTSTAWSIADHLGIVPEGACANDTREVIAGPDLDHLADDEVDALEDLPSVVGRCSPESKVKMIQALHRRGRVVAMTGDGFNDAPSIKIADIGCAMGSGTDVTKGVADIVITDDNFATIVKAVAEGRRIADCIRKFVIHLLSGNVAEVIVLILGLPITLDGSTVFILSPIEILWLNMFTGSPPATGLSLDEAEPTILHVPPNRKGFFTKELIADTIIYGIFLGVSSLMSFIFVVYGVHNGLGENAKNCNSRHGTNCEIVWTARSTAFSVLYMGLMIHAYNVRSQRTSVLRMKWFDNNWLWGSVLFGMVTLIVILYVEPIARNVFVHQQLTWEWGVVLVAMSVFMILSELYKLIKNYIDPLPIIHMHKKRRSNPTSPHYGNDSDCENQELESLDVRLHTNDERTATEYARDNLIKSYETTITHK
eukprot:Tbor_TRINITY_DN5804_c0_g1::TRINITY_DN5804_c0_g1_i1::g.6128::m.6128